MAEPTISWMGRAADFEAGPEKAASVRRRRFPCRAAERDTSQPDTNGGGLGFCTCARPGTRPGPGARPSARPGPGTCTCAGSRRDTTADASDAATTPEL